MHGYELRREIELRKMERWADVKYGSIYPALRRLTAAGAIEALDPARTGQLPPRTPYRITDAGRAELQELLREAWRRPRFNAHAVDVALVFAPLLAEGDIEQLLDERLGALDAVEEALRRAEDDAVGPEPGVRAIVSDVLDHSLRLVGAEREWTRHVLDQLVAGAYATTGDRPAGDHRPKWARRAQGGRRSPA